VRQEPFKRLSKKVPIYTFLRSNNTLQKKKKKKKSNNKGVFQRVDGRGQLITAV
jgi:hypothetical protein